MLAQRDLLLSANGVPLAGLSTYVSESDMSQIQYDFISIKSQRLLRNVALPKLVTLAGPL